MRSIVAHVVRHGESEWNFAHRIQGQSPDAGSLTDRGRRDATAAAEDLKRVAPATTLVVTSDIARARETAEVIATRLGVPIAIDPDFREIRLGTFEGHSTRDPWLGGTVGDATAAMWSMPDEPAPGGESVAELTARVLGALGRWTRARTGEDIVFVCHGGPVRALLGYAEFGAVAPSPRRSVENGSIAHFSVAVSTHGVELSVIERRDAAPRVAREP